MKRLAMASFFYLQVMKKWSFFFLVLFSGCSIVQPKNYDCKWMGEAEFTKLDSQDCVTYILKKDDYRQIVEIRSNLELPTKFKAKYQRLDIETTCKVDEVIEVAEIIP